MFEQTLAVPVRANRAVATMCGLVTQSVLVTAAVMIPMLFPDSIPRVQTVVSIFTPGPPPPPPPPPGVEQPRTPVKVRVFQMPNGVLTEPTRVPEKAQMIIEEPLSAAEMGGRSIGGVVGGTEGGVPGGVIGSILTTAAPRPPAPPPPQAEPVATVKAAVAPAAPLNVGGKVQEAKLIHRVIPPYPPLARQARISGVVQLSGWISTTGRIRELTVLSGHPLLVKAAIEGVSQWVYEPTLLNGKPVEVIAPISVNFVLN